MIAVAKLGWQERERLFPRYIWSSGVSYGTYVRVYDRVDQRRGVLLGGK